MYGMLSILSDCKRDGNVRFLQNHEEKRKKDREPKDKSLKFEGFLGSSGFSRIQRERNELFNRKIQDFIHLV